MLADLAKKHENLAAVKYSTQSIRDLYDMATADTDLAFYVVDSGYEYASLFGDMGLISSFIAVDSARVWDFFKAGQAKDYPKLIKMARFIRELSDALVKNVDLTRIDSAYDKAFVRFANPAFPSRLYPPYEGMNDADFMAMSNAMKLVLNKYSEG